MHLFNDKIPGKQFFNIVWLNLAIGFAIAVVFWIAKNQNTYQSFSDEIIVSFIHSAVYGLSFGVVMTTLGDRLSIIRPPWNWVAVTLVLLFLSFGSTLLVEICLLNFGYSSFQSFRESYFFKSSGVFFVAFIISFCIHLYDKFRTQIQATNLKAQTQELEKERALKLAADAHLALLKSRLHPHFLFNALNSISALISENPPLADKMLQNLASLLRASLDSFENNKVLLNDEINLIRDYLEIEKVRFRERLVYKIQVEPQLETFPIPPLILQPMVENSIKYAVSPRPAGGKIEISVSRKNNELLLEVWDNGDGFSAEMIPAGHGLNNLRSRLQVLYGEAACLFIEPNNKGMLVGISIQTDDFSKQTN